MVSIPIVETVVNLLVAILRAGGLPALFALMVVESFGIPPLPSEVILPFAGFLVWEGAYSYGAAVTVAVVGGVVGAYIAYAVGRWGRGLLTSGPPFLRVEERHLDRMDAWFRQYGPITVLVARLLPVVRSYVSYPAGTTRMEPARFGAYTAIGATPFAAAFIYLGLQLGNHWDSIVPVLQLADDVVLGVLVVAAVYVVLRWRRVIGPGFPPRRPSAEPADRSA